MFLVPRVKEKIKTSAVICKQVVWCQLQVNRVLWFVGE